MSKPGELYRPSNGTEGMIFMEDFCCQCIHERWMHHPDTTGDDGKCPIVSATMAYDTSDKEYPKEWTYDAAGKPTCTKWVKFDWGSDDDPREPGPKPPPEDPRQFLLPYDITDFFPFADVVVTKHAIIEVEVEEQLRKREYA